MAHIRLLVLLALLVALAGSGCDLAPQLVVRATPTPLPAAAAPSATGVRAATTVAPAAATTAVTPTLGCDDGGACSRHDRCDADPGCGNAAAGHSSISTDGTCNCGAGNKPHRRCHADRGGHIDARPVCTGRSGAGRYRTGRGACHDGAGCAGHGYPDYDDERSRCRHRAGDGLCHRDAGSSRDSYPCADDRCGDIQHTSGASGSHRHAGDSYLAAGRTHDHDLVQRRNVYDGYGPGHTRSDALFWYSGCCGLGSCGCSDRHGDCRDDSNCYC
jgi:hypothetical protein